MPRAGFESAIPATKRPETYALDPAATGTGILVLMGNVYEGVCVCVITVSMIMVLSDFW
jgi:hypothetical protein